MFIMTIFEYTSSTVSMVRNVRDKVNEFNNDGQNISKALVRNVKDIDGKPFGRSLKDNIRDVKQTFEVGKVRNVINHTADFIKDNPLLATGSALAGGAAMAYGAKKLYDKYKNRKR